MHQLRGRLSLLLLGLLPSITWAQAWLPDRGTIGASYVHNDIENNDHYLPNGDELDVGHTRTFSDAVTLALFALGPMAGIPRRTVCESALPRQPPAFRNE